MGAMQAPRIHLLLRPNTMINFKMVYVQDQISELINGAVKKHLLHHRFVFLYFLSD